MGGDGGKRQRGPSQMLMATRAGPGRGQESASPPQSPHDWRSSTWTIFYCLLGHISRELGQKQSSQDSNRRAYKMSELGRGLNFYTTTPALRKHF